MMNGEVLLESRSFTTAAEAQAFREGLDYVNDSAIEVVDVVQRGDGWVVQFTDSDGHND